MPAPSPMGTSGLQRRALSPVSSTCQPSDRERAFPTVGVLGGSAARLKHRFPDSPVCSRLTALAAGRRGRSGRRTVNSERGAPMSGTENTPAGTLEERLRLGAGFGVADRPRILAALSALAPHLSGWEHGQVELEVSVKD